MLFRFPRPWPRQLIKHKEGCGEQPEGTGLLFSDPGYPQLHPHGDTTAEHQSNNPVLHETRCLPHP